MTAPLYKGNAEPPLSQMLDDPIMLCLMTSDGVEMTELLALLIQTAAPADKPGESAEDRINCSAV